MSQSIFEPFAAPAQPAAGSRREWSHRRRARIGLKGGIGLLFLSDATASLLGPHLASILISPTPTMAAGSVNGLIYGGLAVLALLTAGLYSAGTARAPLAHAGTMLRALIAADVLALLRIALLRPAPATLPLGGSFGWAACAFALTATLLIGGRMCVATLWRRHGIGIPHGASALVSATPCDRILCARLDRLAGHRLGYVFCWGLAPISGLRTIADATTLEAMIRSGQIGDLVVFIRRGDGTETRHRIDSLLARLADQPVRIRLAFDAVAEIGAGGLATGQSLRLVTVLDQPIRPFGAVAKRSMDVIGASLLIVLLSPLLTLIAVALRTTGPVLFRQRRIGLDGAPFTVFKFRTMRPQPRGPAAGPVLQAQPGDRRITRLGVVLRRLSLDELPQLFNVLRGEMSLVGPRPHAPHTSAGDFTFEKAIAFYGVRHRVKPGLTGLAQVRGLRGPTDRRDLVAARVAADLDYIERWSLWLDLAILLRTIPAVLIGRNAI
jgi:exopolysaccharide biosynthesis polyprenyl glycosylphosphotransferase